MKDDDYSKRKDRDQDGKKRRRKRSDSSDNSRDHSSRSSSSDRKKKKIKKSTKEKKKDSHQKETVPEQKPITPLDFQNKFPMPGINPLPGMGLMGPSMIPLTTGAPTGTGGSLFPFANVVKNPNYQQGLPHKYYQPQFIRVELAKKEEEKLAKEKEMKEKQLKEGKDKNNLDEFCIFKKNLNSINPYYAQIFLSIQIYANDLNPNFLIQLTKKHLSDIEKLCKDSKSMNTKKSIQKFLIAINEIQKKQREIEKSTKDVNTDDYPKFQTLDVLRFMYQTKNIQSAPELINFEKHHLSNLIQNNNFQENSNQLFEEAQSIFMEKYNNDLIK